jgi:hypothetical protein
VSFVWSALIPVPAQDTTVRPPLPYQAMLGADSAAPMSSSNRRSRCPRRGRTPARLPRAVPPGKEALLAQATARSTMGGARRRKDAVSQPGSRRAQREEIAVVRIGSVVMNVSDIHTAAGFWGKALGYRAREGSDGAILVPDSGGEGPALLLDRDDRMHLDLWAANEEEQAAEVERLISLGATRVDWVYPENADFVVLADTEGNLFCVVDAGRD